MNAILDSERITAGTRSPDSELDQVEAEAEADWKDALLDTLLKMSPTAFERLAQRLLRAVGVLQRGGHRG